MTDSHPYGSRWALPQGSIMLRALRNEPAQEYLLYLPTRIVPNASVLVSVHGISRNAREQAGALAEVCDRTGAVLVVPIFEPEMHADYQRLGRRGRGVRADLALNRCLEEVGVLTGIDVTRILLIGFSGGAQFVHRYVMAHPERVQRAMVVAAGWYTLPDPKQRFPYGIRSTKRLPGVVFNPERFLQVPIDVLVGLNDVGLASVRTTERVNSQQGTNRVERARNWVKVMREAARTYGLEPRVTLSELQGVGHAFASFCEHGDLISRVESTLFADERDAEAAFAQTTPGVSSVVSVALKD